MRKRVVCWTADSWGSLVVLSILALADIVTPLGLLTDKSIVIFDAKSHLASLGMEILHEDVNQAKVRESGSVGGGTSAELSQDTPPEARIE